MYRFHQTKSTMVYVALYIALVLFSSIPSDKGNSNGRLWNDYLSERLDVKLDNFAFSGATVDNQVVPRSAPSVKEQAQKFYKSQVADTVSYNEGRLFAIWIGINDNYDLFFSGAAPSKQNEASLYQHGARHFFIPNVPPVEALPLASDRVKGYPAIIQSPKLREYVIRYNTLLEKSIQGLASQFPDANVQLFDVHSLFDQFIQSPEKFGFSNVKNPCQNNFAKCAEPDKYLFWDKVHPTTYAHRLIADAFYNAL
ncbi:uncharacterized protein VTP21DRAFT_2940 [Calcarisporiella thermophila]|uniref:uncharacterized protein n=1 Tax=Calcarisporiella thermophila TaxID=911321 RepID=UPI0037435EDA